MWLFSFLNSSQSNSVGRRSETGDTVTTAPKYHVLERSPKLYKATCRGNVPKVQQLLLLHPDGLNDRLKRKR